MCDCKRRRFVLFVFFSQNPERTCHLGTTLMRVRSVVIGEHLAYFGVVVTPER